MTETQVLIGREKIRAYLDDIGKKAFYALTQEEGFPAVKIGKRWMATKAGLDAWFVEKTTPPIILWKSAKSPPTPKNPT